MAMKTQKGNTLLIALVLVAVIGVGGYLLLSNRKVGEITNSKQNTSLRGEITNETPDEVYLNIGSPTNGETLKTANVTVRGETTIGGDVFVNDKETKADEDGVFSVDLTLDEGQNDIVVTVNDDQGNTTEQTLSVNVQTF